LFECLVESRVFSDSPPPIADLDPQRDTIGRIRETSWSRFKVRRADPTHLGVVALVSGDLPAARTALSQAGVAHVYEWDDSVAEVGVDGPGQVHQVLQWLLDPALRDVRRATRGTPGYASVAYWQKAGAILLTWKAPIPARIGALAGVRSDGAEVIVEAARFSERDVQAASHRVATAIRRGQVKAAWSTMHPCGDGSGLVVGIQPASLDGRRATLQSRLRKVAGMPVYLIPEQAPVSRFLE
jgi:hypothetical protein